MPAAARAARRAARPSRVRFEGPIGAPTISENEVSGWTSRTSIAPAVAAHHAASSRILGRSIHSCLLNAFPVSSRLTAQAAA